MLFMVQLINTTLSAGSDAAEEALVALKALDTVEEVADAIP
jgi:hypothetical protein